MKLNIISKLAFRLCFLFTTLFQNIDARPRRSDSDSLMEFMRLATSRNNLEPSFDSHSNEMIDSNGSYRPQNRFPGSKIKKGSRSRNDYVKTNRIRYEEPSQSVMRLDEGRFVVAPTRFNSEHSHGASLSYDISIVKRENYLKRLERAQIRLDFQRRPNYRNQNVEVVAWLTPAPHDKRNRKHIISNIKWDSSSTILDDNTTKGKSRKSSRIIRHLFDVTDAGKTADNLITNNSIYVKSLNQPMIANWEISTFQLFYYCRKTTTGINVNCKRRGIVILNLPWLVLTLNDN